MPCEVKEYEIVTCLPLLCGCIERQILRFPQIINLTDNSRKDSDLKDKKHYFIHELQCSVTFIILENLLHVQTGPPRLALAIRGPVQL